jgi:N-acetylneuraminate synthase
MSVLLIAEIGVNHNGSLEQAIQLVDAATNAGADVVKFQSFKAELLAVAAADKARYQKTATGRNQLELLKSLELSESDHHELLNHCKSKQIEFLSTGFDESTLNFLVGLGIQRIKVPSGEITNLPYLRHVGAQGLPVLLSTGMANLGEIEAAIDLLESKGTLRESITVLHCTTEYPAPITEVNLRAMESIREAFCVSVGYSDHTAGSEVAIAAVAMGAEVIEKHITLDRSLQGPDHAASMEPDEFSEMARCIRSVESALGDGIKRPGKSERQNISVVRKSLVASTTIRRGEIYSHTNIAAKRPGTGLSPMLWDSVIGREADRDYKADELIEW